MRSLLSRCSYAKDWNGGRVRRTTSTTRPAAGGTLSKQTPERMGVGVLFWLVVEREREPADRLRFKLIRAHENSVPQQVATHPLPGVEERGIQHIRSCSEHSRLC